MPMVLVHGLAYTARTWDFVAPLLAEKGWLPLAPDLRGHGRTDKPAGEYTFDVIFNDLAAFLEVTNIEKPLLVGHSWGGMAVLDYAARVTLGPRSPSGIVLVDGGIGRMRDIPGSTWEKVRDLLSPTDLSGLSLKQLESRLRKPNQTWTITEEVIPSILDNYEIDQDEFVTPRLNHERHLQILKSIWEFDACACYPKLKCPVMMIPTQPKEPLDRISQIRYEYRKKGIEQARASIQNLSVHWMRDTVHDIPYQRPVELAILIHQFGVGIQQALPL